ncbi:hypothetical protein HF292_009625 [Acidithiobacillus ferruginosus]|uniref:Uncharacterized protein n=1 Tax=Acidithiobacillus ferruginosus TaxID=3063951 RepID=A0ACD5IGH5_9PROT|nr:hypothetical protein [Acidithiobacillus ferruginosus]MBU2813558.1 hypothetical protein [Acidithiobacillus ferruginosus]
MSIERPTTQEARLQHTPEQVDLNDIANILLLAVLDSQGLNDAGTESGIDQRVINGARRWLAGPLAELLFRTLDINPEAALDRLYKKWAAADARVDQSTSILQ